MPSGSYSSLASARRPGRPVPSGQPAKDPFFGGEGLIMLQVTGKGTLIFSTATAPSIRSSWRPARAMSSTPATLVTFRIWHMKYQVKKVGGLEEHLVQRSEGLVAG